MADYVTEAFTAVGSHTWEVPTGVTAAEVLIVGGGGGGGRLGGGGGAGQVRHLSAHAVTPGATLSLSVGDGGPGSGTTANNGSDGSQSDFDGIVASGGGGGGSQQSVDGSPGASGGGGGSASGGGGLGGSATSGNAGGDGTSSGAFGCGGGGGAGTLGSDGTTTEGADGGAGLEFSQFSDYGASGFFAGGGGGGSYNGAPAGSGKAGGGDGSGSGPGATAEANTGSGGGGGDYDNQGGDGAAGIILVRYSILTIGTANEVDTANSVSPVSIVTLGTATESDAANTITNGTAQLIVLGTAAESEAPGAITAYRIVSLDPATESDSAGSITPQQLLLAALGVAVESEAANGIAPAHIVHLGTASEADTAGDIHRLVRAWAEMPSIFTAGRGLRTQIFHDWTGAIPETAVIRYVCDILDDTTFRVRISSWQATLQVDRANFLQAVVPGVSGMVSALNAASGKPMVIKRRAEIPGGAVIEQEIARSPLNETRFARGPGRHTATLAGYETAFTSPEEASAATTRTLREIRSISTQNGGLRVRCGIDWFLRPGQNAIADGDEFTASYINYYVTGRDAYMDVGERAL